MADQTATGYRLLRHNENKITNTFVSFAELLDIEPRLNRIRGYKYLPGLGGEIQMELAIEARDAVAA